MKLGVTDLMSMLSSKKNLRILLVIKNYFLSSISTENSTGPDLLKGGALHRIRLGLTREA